MKLLRNLILLGVLKPNNFSLFIAIQYYYPITNRPAPLERVCLIKSFTLLNYIFPVGIKRFYYRSADTHI